MLQRGDPKNLDRVRGELEQSVTLFLEVPTNNICIYVNVQYADTLTHVYCVVYTEVYNERVLVCVLVYNRIKSGLSERRRVREERGVRV